MRLCLSRVESTGTNGIYIALRLEASADNPKMPALIAECVSGVHRKNVLTKRFSCVKNTIMYKCHLVCFDFKKCQIGHYKNQ